MAVLYAAIFASAGIQLPFLPVWLEAKGLDAREIGLVLAAAMLARPVIVPAAMRLIDRYGWAKGPLVAAAWAACATFVTVALSDGFAAIIVAFAISALPQALVLPLADAYALRGLAARERAYGPVRMWGSGAFIAANLGGGLVLERLGAAQVIWVLVAALAATALSATALVPLATRSHASVAPRSGAPSLWRSPAFVAVVAAASLIQASHAVLYGFASLGWAGKGLDGPAIGALWAIGVLAEIGLFAASGRIMVRVRPLDLIGVEALGALALDGDGVRPSGAAAALAAVPARPVVRRDASRRDAFSCPLCRRALGRDRARRLLHSRRGRVRGGNGAGGRAGRDVRGLCLSRNGRFGGRRRGDRRRRAPARPCLIGADIASRARL
ncbi:MAG: MFS transporter [Rhodoplanes sp.]